VTGTLDDTDRAILEALATDDGLPPAGIALALDLEPATVLDRVADLADRGLVDRHRFDTCVLTDAGAAAVDADRRPEATGEEATDRPLRGATGNDTV
jgi:DNA-binding Lrp family transcriptional regulator